MKLWFSQTLSYILTCNYSTNPSYNDYINCNGRTITFCNEPYQMYVKSTVTTERLSALATLHIYTEIEIDR
jgi:hypothetical protein